jgi:hypothetical protein
MHGTSTPVPIYAFMVWCLDTGVALPFVSLEVLTAKKIQVAVFCLGCDPVQ